MISLIVLSPIWVPALVFMFVLAVAIFSDDNVE